MENINDLKGLKLSGFNGDIKKFDVSIFQENEKVDLIRPEIKKFFRKTKTFNNDISSYGLKHVLERHIDNYVSNGELIYAMHLEGFKIKRDGINCFFNVSNTGIGHLRNSKTIMTTLSTPLNFPIDRYIKHFKKYQKYKYNFKYLIDSKFSNETRIKRYVPEIIAYSINESSDNVRYWINLLKIDNAIIPQDILEMLSNIFNLITDELINNN